MNAKADGMPPLALAYLGDAVFELCVRRYIVEHYDFSVNEMNEYARGLVNAAAQADMCRRVSGVLTEDEAAVLKRGRNAKSKNAPKNVDVMDYRYATGLEALFGYLYLKGEGERVRELFSMCLGDGL